MAMAKDRGRQCTMRSAFILLVALQLLFSRFISFRVIAYFFRDHHQRNRLLCYSLHTLAFCIIPTSTYLPNINYPHSSWQLPLVPVLLPLPPLPPAELPGLQRPPRRPEPRERELRPRRIVSRSLLPPDAICEAMYILITTLIPKRSLILLVLTIYLKRLYP